MRTVKEEAALIQKHWTRWVSDNGELMKGSTLDERLLEDIGRQVMARIESEEGPLEYFKFHVVATDEGLVKIQIGLDIPPTNCFLPVKEKQ